MTSRYSKEQLSLIVRKNIKKYRLMRKYTLQELADLTSLTHGYVRDLECLSIDKTPLLETIGKFADALEIDIRQLFDDSN
ncbi:MAG TPA: helix-turn-helix transcriptional regulator [Candidatus Faecimonas intestinavium]|nr:helix-turn-helix transcriptional regulator [Candidatus Faecimonas intestinavium]